MERAIAAVDEAAEVADSDAEIDELDRRLAALSRLSEGAWLQAGHSPSALRATALVAKHWHHGTEACADDETGECWEGPWRKPSDCDDWGDRTFAELIDAVLRFTNG